jgi:hypothetical protein
MENHHQFFCIKGVPPYSHYYSLISNETAVLFRVIQLLIPGLSRVHAQDTNSITEKGDILVSFDIGSLSYHSRLGVISCKDEGR